MTARGIRLNNPGDIRHSKIVWQGQSKSQPDPDFVAFDGPEWGVRAMAKILLSYEARGVDTVREIVTTWAPPEENDTAAYIAAVCKTTGFEEDQVLNLKVASELVPLLKALVVHETGSDPYPDCIFANACALAGVAAPSIATAGEGTNAAARPAGFRS